MICGRLATTSTDSLLSRAIGKCRVCTAIFLKHLERKVRGFSRNTTAEAEYHFLFDIGQTLIGAVDVKSTPVYFHVQRNSTFSTGSNSNATISFHSALVNIGEAMDVTSGIFTAPKAGTYFFAFNGVQYSQSQLYVSLDLNGQRVATTVTYGFGSSSYPVSLSLVSTLELETDDEVRLIASGQYLLEGSNLRYTQFTGALLQENLSF
jgi:C1q domain